MTGAKQASTASSRSEATEAALADRDAPAAARAGGEATGAAPADGGGAADARASGHARPAMDPQALELIASTGC